MASGLILGIITGLTYGMLAVGIVLVYKSSRFVNLAHGSLGALSAVLLATLVLDTGLSWWMAFPIVIAVGIGLGLGVERSIVRPLRHRKRRGITLLLVTIGISQLLLALTYIPAFAPDPTLLLREQYPLPFTLNWRILDTDITGPHLMILALVPATVGVLAVFLRSTMLGKSIRAAASNADAARLCGVSVDRVNAITWGIAGALSAVTAVLLAPGQSVFDAGALGPGLLIRALGAAALGGFVSIPAAMVGGVGLGVIEGVTLSTTSRGTTAELAVFLAVIAVLFLRGRVISAAADADDTAEDHSTSPVPASVADRFIVRHHRTLLGGAGLLVAMVLPLLPYLGRTENRFLLTIILVFAIVGVGLTMLLGWAGQVSLGHFALVGVGAFGAARLAERDLSLPFVFIIVGLLGAAIMTLVGLPALRLRGLTLAVTTLGFAVVAPAWLFTQPWFGVERGAAATIEGLGLTGVGRLQSDLSIYYTALALLVATAVVAGLLRRSVRGRLIVAARDNERALAMFGVTPATVKLATLAVSGFMAASAGVIWGAAWRNVSTNLVSPSQSLALLVIPVVGGLGSVSGAVAGAFAIFVPTYFIGPELSGLLGDFGRNLGFQLALSGLGLVLIPLAYPAGVAGVGRRWWDSYLARLSDSTRRASGDTDDAAVPVATETPSITTSLEDLAPSLGEARSHLTASGDRSGSPNGRRRPSESVDDPLIVEDVSLSFGGIRALSNVNLRVRSGEIVGLIGTNGAGKTTLINVISGMYQPAAGRVTVDGVDVTDLAPEIRAGYGLGRSFQDARLFPGLSTTVAVQVALANKYKVGVLSSLLGAPWAREADERSRREALDLLQRTGLATWESSLTSELSTGMRRITDLTMQVAARPHLLLLDEPAGGVAQREAEALGPMLRDLRDELDCGMLIVEHDMPLLMGVCDRIYAMEAGRIIAEGTPEEVRNNPAVVASYLGTDAAAIERSGAKAPTPAAAGATSTAVNHSADGERRRRQPLTAKGPR